MHQRIFLRPIIPKDDHEEITYRIRKDAITNQLRHSGLTIAETGIKLNDKEEIIRHILKQKEDKFTDKITYRF